MFWVFVACLCQCGALWVASRLRPDLGKAVAPLAPPWLGGDVATSLLGSSPSSPSVWLFGDTLLGDSRRRIGAMPRNSVAWRLPGPPGPPLAHFWRPADANQTGGFFNSARQSEGNFLWALTGACVNDTLFLLASEVRNAPFKPAPFQFEILASTLIVVPHYSAAASPLDWKSTQHSLSFTNRHLQFGMATSVSDGYLYLLGMRNQSDGVMMRVPLGELESCAASGLDSCAQFRSGGNWTRSFPGLDHLDTVIPNTPPETTITWNALLQKWILLDIPYLSKEIFVRLADSIDGPYSERLSIFTIPAPFNNSALFFCYAPKMHAQLAASDKELIFTFMSNAFNISELSNHTSIYVPQFVQTTILSLT